MNQDEMRKRLRIPLEEIRLTHVRVPLREPFAISNGVVSEKDAIIVEIKSEELAGLGEASPMAGSFYSHHTPDTSWKALSTLVEHVNASGTVDLSGQWCAGAVDDPFATCGVDGALWDLAGRSAGKSLADLLNSPSANQCRSEAGLSIKAVESGLAVGIVPTVQQLLERIEHYLNADGYKRVKIKVQPGWDVEPLAAIRSHWPDLPLMVDANCAYGREHIRHIASWDRFGMMMIEQPLAREDLEGHAELTASCATPVCLDESAESVEAVARAISMRSARIINIKLQRLGTMAAALQVLDMTREAGIGCWMGTMPELAIGGWAAIHFATLPNVIYPTDVESSERWFVEDITDPPIRCRNGLIPVPGEPGLGVRLNPDVVQRYKVREYSAGLRAELHRDPTEA